MQVTWTPVTEGLPDYNVPVWVTFASAGTTTPFVKRAWWSAGHGWMIGNEIIDYWTVLDWAPYVVPEPWEGK